MKRVTYGQYVARKRRSAWIERTLPFVILVAVLGFFSTGCGDNPMAPEKVTGEIDPQAYVIFDGEFSEALDDSVAGGVGQSKKGNVLNIAVVGDFGQPFFEEAYAKFEQLKVLYPQYDFQWIHYPPGSVDPKLRSGQNLYERLVRKEGLDPALSYPGFIFWDNKRVLLLAPVAPMEVLQFFIDNW